MRKIILVLALFAITAPSTPARADAAIGLFVGEPLGLDLKFGVGRRSALDILAGATSYRSGRVSYGHLTYLVTAAVGRGDSMLIPLRLGIGGAVYGNFDNDLNLAVRAPIQVGLRFRSGIELYGEIAIKLTLIDGNNNNEFADLDGGIGLRFYF
ncbi:MAG: hypothetical protein KF773_26070 [Deltaproteobacteria bacterium]|nr:hypothetical protein [Deltaproteobacteria bacterium]MCW5802590.1 hypothetical protein [Deltaproteobacteria bacterium]